MGLKHISWLGRVLALMQPICLRDLESQEVAWALAVYEDVGTWP